jgi:hypothetical protein
MKPTKAIFVLPLFLLIVLAAGAPDEAMGEIEQAQTRFQEVLDMSARLRSCASWPGMGCGRSPCAP